MDLMVLSVLADGANYDYLIQKHIREPGHGGVQLLVGTLYSLLHRLESDGEIRSKWDAKTGRNRKWHELTEAGRRRLQAVVSQWDQYAICIRQLLTDPAGKLTQKGGCPLECSDRAMTGAMRLLLNCLITWTQKWKSGLDRVTVYHRQSTQIFTTPRV